MLTLLVLLVFNFLLNVGHSSDAQKYPAAVLVGHAKVVSLVELLITRIPDQKKMGIDLLHLRKPKNLIRTAYLYFFGEK